MAPCRLMKIKGRKDILKQKIKVQKQIKKRKSVKKKSDFGNSNCN